MKNGPIMKIRIYYTAQLKLALGLDSEEIEVPSESRLLDLLQQIRQLHPQEVEQYVFSAQDELLPGVLLCLGDKHAGRDLSVSLQDGEEVTLLSVVSGG